MQLAFLRNQDEPVLLPTNLRPFRPYTPDHAVISQYEWQNVFVYGEEMRKGWRNDLLIADEISGKIITPSEYQCPAFTYMLFSLWVKQLGDYSYPVALGYNFPNTFPPNPLLHVKGEIWKVRPKRIAELDILRQNGVQYKRVRVTVHIPYRKRVWTKRQGTLPYEHLSRNVRVWMYIGIPDYWEECLTQDMYKPAQYELPKNPRVPEHYYFKCR